MYPAGGYHMIQPCDIRGMRKIYSTSAYFDMIRMLQKSDIVTRSYTIAVPNKRQTEKAKVRQNKSNLTNLSYQYGRQTKSLRILGQASNVDKVAVYYNHLLVKTLALKPGTNNNFDTNWINFRGYKLFSIYGLSKDNQGLTQQYKIRASQYASLAPDIYYIYHSKRGITYKLNGVSHSRLRFYNHGKKIFEKGCQQDYAKIYLPNKYLGKHPQLSYKIIQPGLKSSPAKRAKVVKIGTVTEDII